MEIRSIRAVTAVVVLSPLGIATAQNTLEEVTVTAQKREEPLQSVPIAATALTAAALESRFIKDFTDVSGALPNASLEAEGISNYAASFYIRGQGVQNRGPFVDPAVAVIVDGVTEGRIATTLSDFLDIEAIEVLRGPQGTLQGRNVTGGAVLVRHTAPDVNEFGGNFGVLVGNHGRRDVKGVLNMPTVEGSSAFRIAAKWTETDGFHENIFNGRSDDVTGQDRISVLPSFLIRGEQWDLTLRGEYARYRDDSSTLIPRYACRVDPRTNPSSGGLNDTYVDLVAQRLGGDAAIASCAREPSSGSFNVNQDRSGGENAELDVAGITAEFDYRIVDTGVVTYIGNYKDNEETSDLDVDGTAAALNWNTENTQHYQTSQELRFASDFSEFVDFVVGGLYLKQHYTLSRQTFIGTSAAVTTLRGGSAQGNEQLGLFGQANWHFTEALALVTGVRYSKDEKDFQLCAAGVAACDGRFLPISASWSNTSPRVGLNFQANRDLFFYGNWGRGFRAGGFNGEAGTASAAGPFDPEKVDTFEIGAKIDTWGDRLRINAAVFDSTADDLQRTLARATPAGVAEIVTQNAAKANIRGAELEVTALPIDGLTLQATVGYLDAEYDEYCSDINGPAPNHPSLAPCADPIVTPTGIIQPVDLTDLPIARTPDWTGRLNGLYEFAIGGAGTLGLAAEWVYQGRELTLDSGAPQGTTLGIVNFDGAKVEPMRDATNVYNASITWKDGDERYQVSVYGKNLSNEIYFRRLSFASPTLSFGTLSNPREYGVELAYNFGR